MRIEAECRLQDLLRHLYVLIPVLDDRKHYWVGDAEVEKLLHRGEGWLQEHPDREMMVGRYLKHQAPLTRHALDRLTQDEGPGRIEWRVKVLERSWKAHFGHEGGLPAHGGPVCVMNPGRPCRPLMG